jgi:hypothetical protein
VKGIPATDNIGLGVARVSGAKRVPKPPTNKIAEVEVDVLIIP